MMNHYIRCARETGLVLDTEIQTHTNHPMNNYILWVEVTPPTGQESPPWTPLSAEDQVFFKSNHPINPDAQKVILKVAQGQWQHSVNADEQAQRESALKNAAMEAEFQRRLETWCALEPEGHQMRFILAGIEDKNNPRYQAYLQTLESIRSQVMSES